MRSNVYEDLEFTVTSSDRIEVTKSHNLYMKEFLIEPTSEKLVINARNLYDTD